MEKQKNYNTNSGREEFFRVAQIPSISESEVNELKDIILEILLDRAKTKVLIGEDAPDNFSLSNIDFGAFDETEFDALKQNINLLRKMNGQNGSALRSACINCKSAEALYLRRLYEWSYMAVLKDEILLSDILFIPIPATLLRDIHTTPTDIAEKIFYLERHPYVNLDTYDSQLELSVARALGYDNRRATWQNLVPAVFAKNDSLAVVESLLRNVGAIPKQLMMGGNEKKFTNINSDNVVAFMRALNSLQNNTDLAQLAEINKAKVANYFFSSGHAKKIENKKLFCDVENSQSCGSLKTKYVALSLDGLQIDFDEFKLNVPYGDVSKDMCYQLVKNEWLSDDELQELRIRTAGANGSIREYDRLCLEQLEGFARIFGIDSIKASEQITFLDSIIGNNKKEFSKIIFEQSLCIPDLLIQHMMDLSRKDKIVALIKIIEMVSFSILDNCDLDNMIIDEHGIRNMLMSDPRYYNALKILDTLLNRGVHSDLATAHNYANDDFIMYKVPFNDCIQRDSHSFVEVVYNTESVRILLNENIHIRPGDLKKIKSIPSMTHERYLNFENALNSFFVFKKTVSKLQELKNTKNDELEEEFIPMADSIQHFLLNNVITHYMTSMDLREKLRQERIGGTTHELGKFNEKTIGDFLALVEDAKSKYEDFLYKSVSLKVSHVEAFLPQIEKINLRLDDTYIQNAKRVCSDIDVIEDLCDDEPSMKIARINYITESAESTIPFHIEISAIDAMQINARQNERPLINVIDSLPEASSELLKTGSFECDSYLSKLESISTIIVNTAHKHTANVCLPGLQTFFGLPYARANKNYLKKYGSWPATTRARFFAVNPHGNVYIKNTNSLGHEPINSKNMFAVSPIDAILTPFAHDTEWEGLNKSNAQLVKHISYAHALFARIGADNKKIALLQYGDILSVIDACKSLQNGFTLVVVAGTGRLADVSELILNAIEKKFVTIPNTADADAQEIIDYLDANLDSDILDEFYKKDFGGANVPLNDKHAVYRTFFYEYLNALKKYKKNVMIVSVDKLERALSNHIG